MGQKYLRITTQCFLAVILKKVTVQAGSYLPQTGLQNVLNAVWPERFLMLPAKKYKLCWRTYIYPPSWGEHSYNAAAGMHRLSNFAGFVKNNMPFGATYQNPQLTDEESWDMAAFVNSQPRKHKDQHQDYPDLTTKPIDSPFGPYGDPFAMAQHKYGPFKPIADYYKTNK